MKREKFYCLFLVLIILGIFQFGIQKICGFTLVPDEFGYWASAASAVGYDWSDVASLGSYYSFGYSLVLIPILKLFHGGVAAYRAALTVNMLLMCGGLFLLVEVIKRIFPETGGSQRVLISGISILYPPWIFYMQMTMVEALLYFLFILIVCLLISLIQKPKVSTAVLLAVSLIYIYCVHMRTIGVLLAGVITLTVWMVSEHQEGKGIWGFWCVLLVLAALAVCLKRTAITEVFANAEAQTLSGNDYSGQWEKLRQILTVRGMLQFIREVLAKVYYLGTASFGIFYWGAGWTLRESFLLFKKLLKREKGAVGEWTALFLFLAVVGEILISSIYMYQGGLIDTLIYGRYDEFLMPILLMIGILAIGKSRKLVGKTALIGMGTGLLTLMIPHIVKVRNLEGLRGYMVAGISYLLNEDKLNISAFFRNTWLLMCGIMAITVLGIWLSERSKNAAWFLTGILAIEIMAGIQISQHYTYRVNNSNFMDLSIAEKIVEQIDVGDRVLYLDEGKPQYIDFIQMQLAAKPIETVPADQFVRLEQDRQSIFVVTHIDTQHQKELESMFQQCLKANTFYLFYNKKEGAKDEADHTNPLL